MLCRPTAHNMHQQRGFLQHQFLNSPWKTPKTWPQYPTFFQDWTDRTPWWWSVVQTNIQEGHFYYKISLPPR